MKKSSIVIIILLGVILFFLTGCTNQQEEENNKKQEANVTAERTAATLNKQIQENTVLQAEEQERQNKETVLATYETKIKDKSEGRLVNIRLTCEAISGKMLASGEKFSFNEIVGKPTAERGYQEASVIIDHKTEKGIGGGNCQVSSTLYNAVLGVASLEVTERHEHGKDVTYVPDGKDAAVSYGSLDLKFKNNTGKKIRIDVATNNEIITARIVQIGL